MAKCLELPGSDTPAGGTVDLNLNHARIQSSIVGGLSTCLRRYRAAPEGKLRAFIPRLENRR